MTTEKVDELQQLLNTAVEHIRKQGVPSGYRGACEFVCSYKTPDGLQCAAAPFIREYDSNMESWRFTKLAASSPEKLDPVAVRHSDFVAAIQNCHDEPARDQSKDFMQAFEWRVAELARVNGLTVPAAA